MVIDLLQGIQREIKSLQGEILQMGHAAQELLAVANADSHDLIRQSLANLNDRVQILEGQARDQGEKLRAVDRQYKLYQVSFVCFVLVNNFSVMSGWSHCFVDVNQNYGEIMIVCCSMNDTTWC